MKKCFLVDIIVFRGIHGEDILFIMKINFKMTTLRRLKEKHISLLKSTFSKAVLCSFFRSFLITVNLRKMRISTKIFIKIHLYEPC